MSSKSEEKTKHSEGGAATPAAKRQKTNAIVHHQSNRSLLLRAQPEILWKVYSFLALKEALILRQVHCKFNEESNDIYQYSVITSY